MQGEAGNDEIVMALVESALARPIEKREAWLRSECGSDPELYEEVRSRVEWEERLGGFLREPVVARFNPASPAPNPKRGRHNKIRWIAGTAAVVAVIAASSFLLLSSRDGAVPGGSPIRLAILPDPGIQSLLTEIADHLAGARRNFTTISPAEALRNHVENPAQAKLVLGATHVLVTHPIARGILSATITDADSGQVMRQWESGPSMVEKTVADTFHLGPYITGANSRLNPQMWRGLAAKYGDDDKPDGAIDAYRKAIEVQPDYYPSYLDFGRYYLSLGRFAEAEALFRHVTWIAPGLTDGHAYLNRALRYQGKEPEINTPGAPAAP